VLAAFEEQDWARCILDPISPKTGSNSKQRLHDTIDRLNRDHIEPWLRFHGDGSGRAVNWEVLVKIAKSAPIVRR